jgi:6-phosphogluconolactonase
MSTATDTEMHDVVLVQSNDPENRLHAFRRNAGGQLTVLGAYPTGGAGDGTANLASQGSVTLAGDGRFVLVTNAASGDLSVFGVAADGLALIQTVATGQAPKSVAEHHGLIYVLNTGDPSVTGLRMEGSTVVPIAESTRALEAGSDPAQVGFSPDGRTLIVTERGTNAIVSFPVDASGLLGEPSTRPSSGPTPYGFAVTPAGVLVVTEAFGAQTGKAAASSYVIDESGVTPVSRSVGNGRSAICWAVVTGDGRFAYATNFADGAVSRYAIGDDGSLDLRDAAAGITVDGRRGLRDADLSSDGRFLYAIDTGSQQLYGWSVESDGSLAAIGSWGGLPPTVAGLVAG